MKGKMKKAFAALLTATVLIGGMPVNMQANVIAEAEKTESASAKVNEKYADTEELDLMDRERQEMQVDEWEKKENTEQTEPGETEQPDTEEQPDTDVEQEETAQTEIEEETEEIEEPAETEEQAKETEKQEVQPDTEEQSEEAAQQETEEQQDKTEQPEMEEQPEETEQTETEEQPEETDTELPEMEEETEEQEEILSSGTVKSTKDFYYTQEFPEGLKVTLSADKGIVPDDAKVNMELVENERLDHLKTEIREQMEALVEEKAQEDERSIFNMYSDLQVSVEDTYALDIKITYTDKVGNICIYEPKKDQSIQVALEQNGFSNIAGDEMSEVNLFYTSDISENEYRSASAQGAEENMDIELLDDNLDVEGESICFQAEHFSVYVVSVVKYAGNASEDQIAAEQKAWNLINKYADPDYYLKDFYKNDMTDAQYEELHQAALAVVKDCTNQYEKIKAITAFVADRTYYDYMYYYGISDETFFNPYDVYTQKRTVCSGYARLMSTLLISVGIPCMDLHGDNHEYNAVYDGDNQKWIFADATWCSFNAYTSEGEWKNGGYSYGCYDLTPEQLAGLSSHEVYGIDLLKDGLYYYLGTPQDAQTWSTGEWYLNLSGVKNKNITEANSKSGFENLTVRQISMYAFYGCTSLKKVDLSQTEITEIGGRSFYNCTSLETISLPKTLTQIGRYAFYGCTALKGMDLSQTGITEIVEQTFYKCTSLETIGLPKTLTRIGKHAFYGCTALKGMDLSQTGITEIAEWTFYKCTSLETISLPKTLARIGMLAFYGCTSLKDIDMSQTEITEIGEQLFYKCTSLETISLPKTLTRIGKDAFYGCTALKGMDLSQTGIMEIVEQTFYKCTSLETISLPKTLTNIGKIFDGCTSLKNVDLSQTKITEIQDETFYSSGIENIKFPETLTKIGKYAFGECYSLKEIDLSRTKVTEIQDYAFTGNSKLKSVIVPNSLMKMGEGTFAWCNSLETVDLSQTNITEIGSGAFYFCGALKKVVFPISLTDIGAIAFYACGSLSGELDLSGTSIKTIGEGAFYNDVDVLKVIRLPESVAEIGDDAFGWNGTENVNKIYVVVNLSKDRINAKAFNEEQRIVVCPYLYQIKFDGNGATKGNMDTRLCAANEEQCLDNSYQKKGYTFAGWNTQADGKGTIYKENTSVKNLTKNADEVVTLYAQWNAGKYQITYNLNGGKNNKKNPKTYKTTSKKIKLLNPSKKGYVFKGWYRDKKFKKKVTAIEKGSTGKVTLYAKWAKEKYTITYKLNGGKNNKKNPKTYTITSKTIKLAAPTRKGYVFKGWYRDKKCTKKVTSIKKGSTGKMTLYAKWKKK